MKMFQSLANKLDDRSNQFIQKVIPDIYKNVKATYGGFTTEQLNQFTDLHQYMPNGLVRCQSMTILMREFVKKIMQQIISVKKIPDMIRCHQKRPESIYRPSLCLIIVYKKVCHGKAEGYRWSSYKRSMTPEEVYSWLEVQVFPLARQNSAGPNGLKMQYQQAGAQDESTGHDNMQGTYDRKKECG